MIFPRSDGCITSRVILMSLTWDIKVLQCRRYTALRNPVPLGVATSQNRAAVSLASLCESLWGILTEDYILVYAESENLTRAKSPVIKVTLAFYKRC